MHILVIRTSAMGDVALVTPVIRGMRKQHPEVDISLVTQPAFKPFFSTIPGLNLVLPDFKGKHKGLAGIFRLFRDTRKQYRIDQIIDLHDVLRSKILRFFFRLAGVPVTVIKKGRKEKRLVINGKEKVQLRHSVERYCDVFAEAGFPVTTGDGPWLIPADDPIRKIEALPGRNMINIGVAPYARHKLKVWPEEYMVRLLSMISEQHKVKFWLFGGPEDSGPLGVFGEKVPGSSIVAGNFTMEEEIALISRLDLMIAMDSSNMHMAALAGVKVISIWGGTDPLTGFGAWQQPDNYSVRIPVEELKCRPCTVFGKGKCRRGDFACMNRLTPEMILEKTGELLKNISNSR